MHYLAFGSNLHPLRLTERTPHARLIGTTRLDGYRLCFHKHSVDGSAKCNLTYTGSPVEAAFGAIYYLPESEVRILDEIEGVGRGYDKRQLSVIVNDESDFVFTYFASQTHLVYDLPPYDWYKGFVLSGARYHRFPGDYIRRIDTVAAMQDNNYDRRARNEKLLSRLQVPQY